MTVFRFSDASRGQIGFIYSRLEELELCSSPASMTNGRPSTMSWVALPCLRSCGRLASSPRAISGISPKMADTAIHERLWT
jgi:hypothetical protein